MGETDTPANQTSVEYNLPVPLDQMVVQIDGELQPFRKIHRLLDTFEQFLKFITVVATQESLQARVTLPEQIGALRLAILKKLFTPSLGTWLEILNYMVSDSMRLSSQFSRDLQVLLLSKWEAKTHLKVIFRGIEQRICNTRELLSFLVSARNEYAHGGTPPDEQILEDLEVLLPILRRLFSEAAFLSYYWVAISEDNGSPKAILTRSEESLLGLYPFVVVANEHLFFYSDAKLRHKQKLTFLDHLRAAKITDTNAYGALIEIVPEFDACVDFSEYYRQRLSESVIGRDFEARQIEKEVLQRQCGIWFVQGDPGVGKSAMSLYLYNQYFEDDIKIYHMFLHNEAETLTPQAMVASFYKPLLKEGLVPRTDITVSSYADAKRIIHVLLFDAADAAMSRKKRIICVVDGLDEAQRGGAAALDIFPSDPPRGVYFIMFGRRDARHLARVAAKPQWTYVSELNPLGKNAVRAILWQALSKYDLTDHMVDLVFRKSMGNAKYLDLLVEDLIDNRIALNEESAIPEGLLHYIEEIERRLKAENSELPLTEVALLFALCVEPIDAEMAEVLIHSSFSHLHENIVNQTLHRMTEVIRPIVLKGKAPTYQIYHKSFADYFLGNYPRKLADLKKGILRHVVNESSLDNFVEQLLAGNEMPDLVQLEKVTGKLREFRTAYEILVKDLTAQSSASAFLEYLYRTTIGAPGTVLAKLFNDCLEVLFERNPDAHIALVERCLNEYGSSLDLEAHLVDLLVVKELAGNVYARTLKVIIEILHKHRKIKKKQRYENLLNTLGGYARFSGSFSHLVRITEMLLHVSKDNAITDQSMMRSVEIIQRLIYRIIVDERFARALSAIQTKKWFVLKGDEKIGKSILKLIGRIIALPRHWIPLLQIGVMAAAALRRVRIKDAKRIMRDLYMVYDLWQRAFPLVFTSHNNPVASPNGSEMIAQLEVVIRKWLESLGEKENNVYAHIGSLIERRDYRLVSSCFYLGAIFVLPLLKQMWNYSSNGLGEIARYSSAQLEEMTRMLPILCPAESINQDQELTLMQYLLEKDAWRNYFAMVTIIIQGNKQYNVGSRILRNMLTASENREKVSGEFEIENRLRIFRQFFSIYSYLIRRANNLSLIEDMAKDLRWCLLLLLEAFQGTPKMNQYYCRGTIFGQGDPFNPTLPAGIVSAVLTSQDKENLLFDEMLEYFEKHATNLSMEQAARFRKKMHEELVGLSLFFPSFAMRTALTLLQKTGLQHNDVRKSLLATVAAIDALAPGQMERMAEYLTLNPAVINEEIGASLSQHSALDTTGRIKDEILVFAWHECITTFMVYFPHVRKMLIDAASRVFGSNRSTSIIELVREVGVELVKSYFSPEIGEQAKNLLMMENDSPAGI